MLHQIILSSTINYLGKFTLPSYVGTYGWQGMNVYLKINLVLKIILYTKWFSVLLNSYFWYAQQRILKLKFLGLLNGMLR